MSLLTTSSLQISWDFEVPYIEEYQKGGLK